MFKHSTALDEELSTAYTNKGPDYLPRTRYLDEAGKPLYINRLILEDSPYLLQHAHNPVDWYPWGEAAFTEAEQQNKPVFLSIGYSTCHWCHVMEEESFDNEEVAEVMNEYFICIKVDRELHPDVDTYYMSAVMMMQGQGGWPMSSFLTPDRKPFFGATYFRPGQFLTLMHRVNELWQQQQQDLLEQAQHFSQQVAAAMAVRQSLNEIGINVIDLTAQALMNHHDAQHGGFGQAPKFPNEPYLYFLLDYIVYREDGTILDAVTRTLYSQACGGIYDHVGGGFHRYATDAYWLVPHFEKMLYNQANLSYLFTQAWMLTRAKDFKRVAEETLDYVLREMTCPEGGFYSATDADSEGKEGLFFIWDKAEIETLLGDAADEFMRLYQITDTGDFEGKNIPHLSMPLEQYADQHRLNYDELLTRLNKSKTVLRAARNKRVPPIRDDKLITSWNGMMIKAFAFASEAFNRPDYLDAACKAADYILIQNRIVDGELSRSSLACNASIPALQEDYAYLAEAMLAIYDTTLDKKWLLQAQTLVDNMIERFRDGDGGGFFMSARNKQNLLPDSPREIQDNATASGNSVALKVLTRLWRRVGQQQYQSYAQQLVRAFSDAITQRPYICSYMIDGLLELLLGEQGNHQWCCDGHVSIRSRTLATSDDYKIELQVNVEEGWHLTSVNVDSDEYSPLSIETNGEWSLIELQAPDATFRKLGFQEQEAPVFDGKLAIIARFKRSPAFSNKFAAPLLKMKLGLQACNDKQCLAPVKQTLVHFP